LRVYTTLKAIPPINCSIELENSSRIMELATEDNLIGSMKDNSHTSAVQSMELVK
jgi:hypothetical protein